MSGTNTPNSRFVAQSTTAEDQLKSQTVGLVGLSEFRKRRAEVLEQSHRDRTLGSGSGAGTPSGASTPRDGTSSPKPPKKKPKKGGKVKLSFGDDEDEDTNEAATQAKSATVTPARSKSNTPDVRTDADGSAAEDSAPERPQTKKRLGANPNIEGPVPKAMTKAALLREAQTREQLRKEYLAMQEQIKAQEIIVPFVFFDGSIIPGGKCRMKKSDNIYTFLDKARKVGAELGAGGFVEGARKGGWARISADDLMLVRGEIIIPHSYDFYYFIVNKTLAFDGQPIFSYSSEAGSKAATPAEQSSRETTPSTYNPLARPSKSTAPTTPDSELEGYNYLPDGTKVVDKRWYERNKHIFPASIWEEFDPTKDYTKAEHQDREGNKFFF